MGGGKVQIIGGGARGGQTFCWLLTDRSPCPQMTFLTLKTDNIAKIKNRIEKYTFRNTFK